jgi:hypothetical protein
MRIQQLELMGATIDYSSGEVSVLGAWTPQWFQESNRNPIGVNIHCEATAQREIFTLLDRIKSIEILKLSSPPQTPQDSLNLPRLPRLRELDLRHWSGCNLNLNSLLCCTNIETLKLPIGNECIDKFVKALPRLSKLKILQVHARGITGDAFSVLAKMNSLTELDLMAVPSDEVLTHLPQLPTLRKLTMSLGFVSTAKVLQCLRAFPHLEELNLSMGEQQGVLQYLPRLDRLQVFYCSGPSITVDDISGLKQAPNLVDLEFELCKFQPDSFDNLPALRRLLRLRFNACSLPPNCLPKLDRWTSLRQVHVDVSEPDDTFDHYGDAILTQIPPLPDLRDLSLNGSVSIAGFIELGKFHQLEKLEISLDAFSDEYVFQMAQIDTLTALSLEFSVFSKNGLRVLSQFPNLRSLSLAGSAFDNSDIAHDAFLHSLPPLKELRSLNLSGTAIADETLFVMHQYENLESLELSRCHNIRMIPQGWAMKLKNLKELNLGMTNLGPRPLEGLSGASSLRILSLRGTNIALEELPVLPGLRTLTINSKKLPITKSFPFPRLPELLRIETSEGLYSSEERNKLYAKYPGLTVVEQD